MLSSWVFARRHVNLPPMRGEAPTQLLETVAEHTKNRKRTEAVLKISSRDEDRVSMSNPFQTTPIPPMGLGRSREARTWLQWGQKKKKKSEPLKHTCKRLKQKLMSYCAGSSLHPTHTWNGSVWLLLHSTHTDNRPIHPRYLCLVGDK